MVRIIKHSPGMKLSTIIIIVIISCVPIAILSIVSGRLKPNITNCIESDGATPRAVVSEASLRRSAIVSVKPLYPDLKNRVEGIVVARIRVNSKGALEKCEIVESSNSAMDSSVREALKEWIFTSNRRIGKLTFYFRIINGKGTVLDPAEMAVFVNPANDIMANEGAMDRLDEFAYRILADSGQTVLIDIRDQTAFQHHHYAGAINIPLDKLELSVPTGAPPYKHIIIDEDITNQPSSYAAVYLLRELQYQRVSLLVHGDERH